ncbi:hypothetical protein DSO57_1036709 [Entomophthora muscae]|uniref:Uncharacterized protein n=1 Tax=Entomophthora muscae TaxID=34485 RepID=A0ACC2TA94_9FUNG|nr:hypothetical protein DSO57_1036709 [Entomophthora muscae]
MSDIHHTATKGQGNPQIDFPNHEATMSDYNANSSYQATANKTPNKVLEQTGNHLADIANTPSTRTRIEIPIRT